MKCNAGSGAIYGLGIFGAAFYYIQHATTLSAGILGIIKAIFWPGVVLYQVMGMLHM